MLQKADTYSIVHFGVQLMKITSSLLRICFIVGITITLASCGNGGFDPEPFPYVSDVAQFDADVATKWMDVTMSAVKATPGYTPPVAARTYGYVGVTLWESVVNGIPKGESLAGQVNGIGAIPKPESGKQYHWAVVANAAMAECLRKFFPTAPDSIKQRIEGTEWANYQERANQGVKGEILNRSVAYGKVVADVIFEYSKNDGGDGGYGKNFPSSYVVPQGEGLWIPTAPAFQKIPLQPYWGKNRPFVLPSVNVLSACDPGAPIKFSTDKSSDFYKEADEVYTTVKNLTPEQKTIALFWADDAGKTATPPGHSMSICTQLLKENGKDLAFAARAYALMGMAVNDAFIACWECKYKYNVLRPISYIQMYIDTTWNKNGITDPLTTPPFPEYTSGHSVQGGASFHIMKELFGNISFWDKTHVSRGMKARYFSSMDVAVQENAISRLYGGIHYRAAIDKGVRMGDDIGKQVIEKVRFSK